MVIAPNLFVALPARHSLDDVNMAAKTSQVVRLLIKYHRLLWTVRGGRGRGGRCRMRVGEGDGMKHFSSMIDAGITAHDLGLYLFQ